MNTPPGCLMDMFSRLRFLFAKYLQRQCTPDEVEELIVLLQQAEAEEALTEEMQLLWEDIRKNKIQHNVDWDKMYSFIVSSGEQTDTIIKRATSRPRWYYIAAAIFILVIAIPAYWLVSHSITEKNTAAAPVLKNETGTDDNRQTIHLPDGSKVVLNTASKLNYPSAFNNGRRDVYLTGEGFFDIKHMPARPFYVHTGKIIIKVLGTAFNVRAYPHSENIEVTVTRGKVQVLKENKSLGIVTQSQQISFVTQTEQVIARKVDTLSVIAWKPAEIFYNDITMEEAAGRLEQRFNIKIEFANPAIKSCRVTATFSEDDLPDEILAVLCAVSKSGFKTVEDKIVISGKGCN